MTVMRAPHPCGSPGCPALTHERMCPPHADAARQRFERERGSAHARGYGARWRKARAEFLAANPLCKSHKARGQVVAAAEVDHIVPHKGDQGLFWDQTNWQALCKPCHSEKTAKEDGGWANR